MILFEKITWKNFLSTGDVPTTISFVENETNLIVGSNGAGKSTILDALCFVLFNKPYRKINKPQLINSVNEKNCVVEIDFKVGSRQYTVRRGIKPNVFDIIVNGEMLHKEADDRANQKILEEHILKLNYKSFTQIVILGSAGFTPFMQLTSTHRREVIEDLLDIRVFSAMNNLIKEDIRQNKEVIRSLDVKKNAAKDKVQMQEDFIENLEERGMEVINQKYAKIKTIDLEIDELSLKNRDLNKKIDGKTKDVESFNGATKKLRKLGTLRGAISNKVSTLTEHKGFFETNTVCPTCQQDIEEDFRLDRISEAQSKLQELQEGFKQLEESIKEEENRELLFTKLTKEITSLSHDISQNNTRISGLQRQSRDLQSEVQVVTDQLQNRSAEHEKLEHLREGLQSLFDQLAKKKQEINYQNFAHNLLKDGGVKTKIIKKYLPLINQQVNRYLQLMDFYINFKLDEEFVETIQSPIHDKFSYSSFSEGEKMRIDLALLFTWREVARFKNSANTNLLIMDEVFDSSLDGFGTDEFLKIIRYVIKGANIFVISHKTELLDKFENVLKFDKVKGFSKLLS
jgi:DNA repair exonuclease SbcCD ATPase subunit|tara:strand:+ start:733 stop:2445 length:1713 start_codon:yes stop_codon:yes gene_type:complete